jgi:hypothetical protein
MPNAARPPFIGLIAAQWISYYPEMQHKPKALDSLDRYSSAGHGVECLLQEIVREGKESGLRS